LTHPLALKEYKLRVRFVYTSAKGIAVDPLPSDNRCVGAFDIPSRVSFVLGTWPCGQQNKLKGGQIILHCTLF
jgi:hypothetical protein